MRDVKISSIGTSFKMSFLNSNTNSKESLQNISIKKSDSTNKLFINKLEIGTFSKLKYTDYSNGGIEKGRVRFDD